MEFLLKGYQVAPQLAKLPPFLPLRHDGKFEEHHPASQQSPVERRGQTTVPTSRERYYIGCHVTRIGRGLHQKGSWVWMHHRIVQVCTGCVLVSCTE